MYTTKFIGKGSGFSQRHFEKHYNQFCPQSAYSRTKGLTRSPVTLSAIREDILRNQTSKFRPTDPMFDDVVRDATLAWRLPEQVNPIHLNDLPKSTYDTDSSSPGLPWRVLGFKNKRAVLDNEQAFGSIRQFWHLVKYSDREVHPPDCAAYLRSHLVEEGDMKVRSIWGYPATVGFHEACFALPLIKAYRMHPSPIAYGYETARGGHMRIASRFGVKENYLSSDFKNFDKTVPAWLIKIAFDILLVNIDFSKYHGYGTPKPKNLLRAWNFLVRYFINTPIRLVLFLF